MAFVSVCVCEVDQQGDVAKNGNHRLGAESGGEACREKRILLLLVSITSINAWYPPRSISAFRLSCWPLRPPPLSFDITIT